MKKAGKRELWGWFRQENEGQRTVFAKSKKRKAKKRKQAPPRQEGRDVVKEFYHSIEWKRVRYDALKAMDSHEGQISACVDYRAIVAAALRIASRVMRPGVIETASEDYFAQCESFDYADEGAAIRKALTNALRSYGDERLEEAAKKLDIGLADDFLESAAAPSPRRGRYERIQA